MKSTWMDGGRFGRNKNGETGLFPMNYTSTEKSTAIIEEKVENWDMEQVAEWLTSVGLASVAINFIDQEISGDILLDLNIESLKELGISTFGKRYKVMQAINSLKEDHNIVKPTPNASVSATVIRPPTSRSSIRRSNSQSDSATPYQFPRKAPPPPHRPISPTSMSSGSMSRSNTLSSSGTNESRKINNYPSSTLSSSTTQNTSSSINSQPIKTDWSDTSSGIHPLMSPIQTAKSHTLSVSSFNDNTESTTFQAPEHEGWLHKQSDKYKTWNKRWFVLKGTNLFYFKSPKDVRMKGIINLRGYKIIVDETIHTGKYCFKAQHDRERTFLFYTETEETMRVWIKKLMKATIERDFRAPVMSSNHMATVSLDVARRMRPRPPSVIMYNKNQPIIKPSVEMTMLEEEEIEQHQEESEIVTVYPQSSSKYSTTSPPPPQHLDEEEDLIDPQHQSLPPNEAQDYINWINGYLPANRQVIDLASAFRNGDALIELLEAISHKQIRRPSQQKGGSLSVMMLDNIVAAFKFMGREGVQVDGQYTIKDVFSGNEIKIMIMLDAIRVWANEIQGQDMSKKNGVWIDKESGWRGSAMMDQRYNYSN
ncbi:uncharacterized protein BX663DRAFT_524777 [Cokeromyces recurvatus]|uniref:uncharacterized protein n=1 Tax=Cokeromyces recurvatus TaxID=90255 RepID=UPI00221E3FD1|nr:uncharacterized protein BX663DRAFT_524777 [Cokeromyces recurvatus]KAI7898455.1 hypothetical protein BX663DRAFT_524777 [Cokeromyces recurvatus]